MTYPDKRPRGSAPGAGSRTIPTIDPSSAEPPAARAPFDLVHARLLRFFPELVASLGGDPEALLEPAGVAPETWNGGLSVVSYAQVMALLESAARALDCPDFGLRLAARQSGGRMFGPLGRVMRNSKTFGEALRYVWRHNHAHSLAARVWLLPLPDDDMVFSGHDILIGEVEDRIQAIEQILLVGHLEAMHMTDGHARARRVFFRHQPVSPLRVYRRYFGCEVRFGQASDGIAFGNLDLRCPIVRPDPRILREMTAYIDGHFPANRPTLHTEVRNIVLRRLATGNSGNEQVARELNMGMRTLNRRLKAEGVSFQQLKDEVRKDVMLFYLERTDLDLTRISERLGFAEQSVMTRLCSRWFGMSPTRLRNERREV